MASLMLRLNLTLCVAGVVCLAQSPQALFEKGVADFRAGRVAESAVAFDRLIKVAPNAAAQLWLRGISLYYAGRYADCKGQFELHRTVNPDDVENATWHYLCVARGESPAKAKAALLPVGPDSRVPMTEVYALYRGDSTPAKVIAAGGSGQESAAAFFANLYVGLWYEGQGQGALAKKHLMVAAEPRFAQAGGYMHDVAKVHVQLLSK